MYKSSILLFFALLTGFACCLSSATPPPPYFISFTFNGRPFNIESKGKTSGMISFDGCHSLAVQQVTTDSVNFRQPLIDLKVELTCGPGSDYSEEQILALTKDTLRIPVEFFHKNDFDEQFYLKHKPWPVVMYIYDGKKELTWMSSYSKGYLKFSKITRLREYLYECEGNFEFTYKRADVNEIQEIRNGKFRLRMSYR